MTDLEHGGIALACTSMNNASKQSAPTAQLAALYPELSADELQETEVLFDRYLTLALAIYESVLADPSRVELLKQRLTQSRSKPENGDGKDQINQCNS